jgi:hypothetical protein
MTYPLHDNLSPRNSNHSGDRIWIDLVTFTISTWRIEKLILTIRLIWKRKSYMPRDTKPWFPNSKHMNCRMSRAASTWLTRKSIILKKQSFSDPLSQFLLSSTSSTNKANSLTPKGNYRPKTNILTNRQIKNTLKTFKNPKRKTPEVANQLLDSNANLLTEATRSFLLVIIVNLLTNLHQINHKCS